MILLASHDLALSSFASVRTYMRDNVMGRLKDNISMAALPVEALGLHPQFVCDRLPGGLKATSALDYRWPRFQQHSARQRAGHPRRVFAIQSSPADGHSRIAGGQS